MEPFASYLAPGEEIIWQGKPASTIYFKKTEMIVMPFGIGNCCAIAYLYYLLSRTGDVTTLDELKMLPFTIFALYTLFGRLTLDAYRRSKTNYGITANRILINTGIFSSTVHSILIDKLYKTEITNHKDDTGTITLYTPEMRIAKFQKGSWPMKELPMLEKIEDAAGVNKIIQSIKQKEPLPNVIFPEKIT